MMANLHLVRAAWSGVNETAAAAHQLMTAGKRRKQFLCPLCSPVCSLDQKWGASVLGTGSGHTAGDPTR